MPLLFGDRVFGRDGNLVYDFFSLDGILGDKLTVNGKIQPWMKVDPSQVPLPPPQWRTVALLRSSA